MKKLLLLFVPLFLFMAAFQPIRSITVSGTVSDDKGNPLVSASVVEKGTKNSTNTDGSGKFTLTVSSEKATIVISAVGFDTKEVKFKGQNTLNISLVTTTQQMSEVVVTAYGGRGRKEMKSMANSPTIYGYSTGLAGKVAGVQVYGSDKRYRGGVYDSTLVPFNTEDYDNIVENRFLKVKDNPLSTFSIDVDAASYSNVRRYLNMGQLPPAGAVRIEEMINYFKYDYEGPKDDHPFAVHTEISQCPWNKEHKLVLVGLQGKKIPTENLPPSNLVFLIDVSGSMMDENKLPLVKASMKILVDQLRQQDKVSMVVYAGAAGVVLPSTSGADKTKIKDAINQLEAGGSTAGGAGIKLAYKIAKENFAKNGNNRVILCTDGDFNIGASSDDEMERLIEEERKSGVFLTVLGYGMGNYKDNKMQKLADKGNGNHAYIDGLSEAKKVLVNEFGGTLFTIAKDVKLQIEFNPAKVQGYRLIGYENRMLNKEDFNDDKKDAGELGSGHTVTALYEVIPVGVKSSFLEKVDSLRYQKNDIVLSPVSTAGEIMNVKLRYKAPDGDVSKLIEHPLFDNVTDISKTSNNFRFAAAVAEFGMLLRNSQFKSKADYDQVMNLARKAKGNDEEGYRSEFIKLVSNAQSLAKTTKPEPEEEEEDTK